MSDNYKEESELVEALRKNNRARRSIETRLKRALEASRVECDELFEILGDLTEASVEAVYAFDKLRTLGEVDCDPLDYQTVVVQAVEALLFKKAITNLASHKQPQYGAFKDDMPDDDETKDYWAV